jgi:hypothetical protein
MPIAYLAEQFEFPGNLPETLPDVAPEAPAVGTVAELLVTVATLQLANAKLRAERRPLPAEWMTIKEAAYRAGIVYEAMRQWVNRHLVESRREDGLIFVNVASLDARLARLGRVPR